MEGFYALLGKALGIEMEVTAPVSYTHLDVYKRQVLCFIH